MRDILARVRYLRKSLLKDEYPGLVSLEQYLRAHGWENAGVPSEARAES